MKFITEIQLKKSKTDISYKDKLVLLGSCFTENIGNRLIANKFQADINPFGILYNPLSIANSISILIEKKIFSETDLFFHNNVWQSFAHHGSFSDVSKEKSLEKINNRITFSTDNLLKANVLIITFGTAWVYELKETKKVVANCHKLPEKEFNRRRLSVAEIRDTYTALIEKLRQYNSNLQIIFTVSPIRHCKDGAHENQLSKSTLLLAIAELQERCFNVDYFPAYEIMMDELRDYRFYEEDMVHPNKMAIDYIWEKFTTVYFNAKTEKTRAEIEQIIKAESHKPFNPDTKEHQDFLKKIEEKKTELKEKYPYLSF